MAERVRPTDGPAGPAAGRRTFLVRAAAAMSAAAVLVASVAPAGGAPAQRPAPAPMRVIVRDAPLRSALEMALTAGRADFSLDSRVQGLTTADTKAALPLDDVLRALLDGGPMYLELTRADDIYRVTPQAGSPPARLPAPPAGSTPAAAKPRGVLDVPRRLCGVVLDERGQATHALLETGAPGPHSVVEVVEMGRSARRVVSGFPGEAFLTVEKLTADQMTLRDSKNRRIIAPLRGLNDDRR